MESHKGWRRRGRQGGGNRRWRGVRGGRGEWRRSQQHGRAALDSTGTRVMTPDDRRGARGGTRSGMGMSGSQVPSNLGATVDPKSKPEQKKLFVGTCQDLEKKYFRLTGPPRASRVRPVRVLEKSLQHLIQKWNKNNTQDSKDNHQHHLKDHHQHLKPNKLAKSRHSEYEFINDQFKSIRQDLMVQDIRSPLTLSVYETHAKIALQVGDLSEFNRCQTQLPALYTQLDLADKNNTDSVSCSRKSSSSSSSNNQIEFTAYRLLYLFVTDDSVGYLALLKSLQESHRTTHSIIRYAINVVRVIRFGNYIQFFRLYKESPGLCKCFLRTIVDSFRYQTLLKALKGFKPTSPGVDVFQRILGFDTLEESLTYLVNCGVVLSEDCSVVLTKESTNVSSPNLNKKHKNATRTMNAGVIHGTF